MQSEILKLFTLALQTCKAEIKRKLEDLNEKVYTTFELSKEDNPAILNVEVVAPNTFNNDDYGIGIEIILDNSLSEFTCDISVLKTNGPFYDTQLFKVEINEDLVIPEEFKHALKYIRLLPDFIVEIYIRDYAQLKGERLK